MKILFASTVFPHPADPIRGVYNRSLCRAMADVDRPDGRPQVRVVSPRMWRDALTARGGPPLETGRIEAIEYPTFWYPPGVGRRYLSTFLKWSGRRAVRRLTRDWSPDIVLSYWADPDGVAALAWARQLGAKSALIIGGSDVLLMPERPELAGVVEATINRSDLICTVSESLVDDVRRLCPETTATVTCQTQGIDTRFFPRGERADARRQLGLPDAPTLLWVGRLDPIKDLPLLIEAFAILSRERPDVRLVVIGGGEDKPRLDTAIARHGVAAGVRLVGPLPPDRLGPWFQAADATVLSSESEGLPNVLRESLACGRPFASVDVGSVREVGDETCRVLCPYGDAAALAAAMGKVLRPSYLEAAMATPVRTWQMAGEEMVAEFERLLAEPAETADPAARTAVTA